MEKVELFQRGNFSKKKKVLELFQLCVSWKSSETYFGPGVFS